MPLYISADTFQKEFQGTSVLLDLAKESYFAFDPVATLMWNALLTTNSQQEALEVLRDNFSGDQTRLAADLNNFRKQCLEQGWLQEQEPKPKMAQTRPIVRQRFLFLRAWFSLLRTSYKLSRFGVALVYKEYAAEPVPTSLAAKTDVVLERALAAFAKAENFFMILNAPKDCVPRSLALFKFLRSV